MESFVLINPFEVPPEQTDEEFLAGWQAAADYLETQPGFLSARLHRALAPDARFRYVNVAEWASAEEFRAAVTSEGFRTLGREVARNFPALYTVVRTVGRTPVAAGSGEGPSS